MTLWMSLHMFSLLVVAFKRADQSPRKQGKAPPVIGPEDIRRGARGWLCGKYPKRQPTDRFWSTLGGTNGRC